jgi:UDP-2,3-diacylglucosamine hydrolase
MHNRILFASDIHLSPSKLKLADLFFDFLLGPCQTADAIYLLGDIFEGWIGDDHESPFEHSIENALLELTKSGKQVYFMAGNRDFLVKTGFAKRTGCILLPDPTLIDLFGTPTLLMHGDTLCTLDTGYQRFRKIVHHPITQFIFLNLPLSLRDKIFNGFRNASKKSISHKAMNIMDVDPKAVLDTFSKYAISRIIHGHVHRPFVHKNENYQDSERFVLGDWGQVGSYIEATPNSIALLVFN